MLRFGPLKPVGLTDPRTGRRPYAVVQLRREDRAGRMWNLVGFQTRLRIPEQQRVFRMIPGLAQAEFLRYGSIHRNSYVNAPAVLTAHLSLRDDPMALLAGQMTGVEGYTESAATGLLAGINLARMLDGAPPVVPPPTTMLGALYRYLREADPKHFQPMNANFGLLDELPVPIRDKRRKREAFAARAMRDIAAWRDAGVAARAGGRRTERRAARGETQGDPADANGRDGARDTDAAEHPARHRCRRCVSHASAKKSATSRRTPCARTGAISRSSRTISCATTATARGPGRAWTGSRCAGFWRTSRGAGIGKRSIARALSAVRSLYRYLHLTEIVDANPARAVGTPRRERYLPKYLDRGQAEHLFAAAESAAASGRFAAVRNLAMLELFYSTGMRLSELRGLNRADLDLLSQMVKVRGKGRKERIVPVGDHAVRALRTYDAAREARGARGIRGIAPTGSPSSSTRAASA